MMKTIIGIGLLAALAASPAAADVRLCTGASDGVYAAVGKMIAKNYGPGLIVVTDTGGTWGNIERSVKSDPTSAEACDAFIGQPDGVSVLNQGYYDADGKLVGANPGAAAKLFPVGTLHREYLHVLTPKGGAESLSDLEGKNEKIAVGSPGSGAWLIWQNIVYQDSDYGTLIEEPVGGFEAANMVATGLAAAAIFPIGIDSPSMIEIDDLLGDGLQLAEADDGDFNDAVSPDGKQLYEFVKLDGNRYPKLVSSYYSGSVETISWLAGVWANTDRVSRDDRGKLMRAVAKAKKEAVSQYGG